MRTLIVTAGLITEKDTVLVTQRMETSPRGLLWEFPGGKVEEGEDPREALRRELKEELDIEVDVETIFDVVYDLYPDFPILLLVYRCRIKKGSPRPIGCRDIRWIHPKRLRELEMPAADESIRKKLEETPPAAL